MGLPRCRAVRRRAPISTREILPPVLRWLLVFSSDAPSLPGAPPLPAFAAIKKRLLHLDRIILSLTSAPAQGAVDVRGLTALRGRTQILAEEWHHVILKPNGDGAGMCTGIN